MVSSVNIYDCGNTRPGRDLRNTVGNESEINQALKQKVDNEQKTF